MDSWDSAYVCQNVLVAFSDIVRQVGFEITFQQGIKEGTRFYSFVIDFNRELGVSPCRKYAHYERNQLGKWESKEWYLKDICERIKKFLCLSRIQKRNQWDAWRGGIPRPQLRRNGALLRTGVCIVDDWHKCPDFKRPKDYRQSNRDIGNTTGGNTRGIE